MLTVAPVNQFAALTAGTLVGRRYEIERLVGTGAMGMVYAARHRVTGDRVALKVANLGRSGGAVRLRRFLREATTAATIKHPNVIRVIDVFSDDDLGAPVIVMELLEGETLRAFLDARSALSLEETARLFLPVLDAVRGAHKRGIVHRDLKPENIFIERREGTLVGPKVLDFGIAKVLDSALAGQESQSATETGAVVGTPRYMSLEQAMSEKKIDHRTDVWSLGCILFELLTGRRPIESDCIGGIYEALLKDTLLSTRAALPDLPLPVAEKLDACLKKRREERLSDLSELIAVLAPYAGPSVGCTLPPRRPRRRNAMILAGALITAIAAVGVVLAWPRPLDLAARGPDSAGSPDVEAPGSVVTATAGALPSDAGTSRPVTTATSTTSEAERTPSVDSATLKTVSRPKMPAPTSSVAPTTQPTVVPSSTAANDIVRSNPY